MGQVFIKKSAGEGEVSGVRFINGMVSLKGVKLNVHCFETDGVLIDTGSQSVLNKFKPFFAKADVDYAVVTHSHEDHTGGARFLQTDHGLPIYMNKMTIGECADRAKYPMYRKFFWGKRRPFEAEPIGETFTSRNANWKVIPTPGHASDHLAFLNEETGQLFSGDLYVHPKTKVVLRDESIPIIIRSIEKTLSYNFGEMFCCHAGYVKDGRKALTEKLDYLEKLRERTLALHKQGYGEKEIHTQLFPKNYPITKFSSGEWDSIHIIHSILADQK
ncbi:hypothetical protein HMPREF9372_2123 [Sporosarcina newyorkensis 2681]|uniref:Metallo-beta-lactamase domain-containing protein n=1 Tax=Sporosarcina newyorkensis 2681 TaxID=1027292 RepID=F9DTJ2_9BACL|nr:hypothetical protein HMPREF9372_2123 [Sporosarcina newyorkensis 2681]